ncbi:MAG: tyrosine-type recombinase/integrase [Nitrososphaeraceae archaeon]
MQVLTKLSSKNNQYARVSTFLNSIGRNSKNSKVTYNTGLVHFTKFLVTKKQTPDTIIPLLIKGKINVYELLDEYVSYLSQLHIAVPSIRLYFVAVRSYLEYNDIDISNSKFKRRVKIPRYYPDSEEPLSVQDIREMLTQCRNERLACYLLLLISTGMRATEAASLRLKDIDFSVSPTRITVRREISKTRRGRVIYCSDEATKQIRILMEQQKRNHTAKQPDDFLFSIRNNTKYPKSIYLRMLEQFERLQQKVHKDEKKENSRRRKITFHSFRRTAFTIINQQTNSEYSNWYLGHNHSVYWTHTEKERREIYAERCMPNLTVLDYTLLDTQQKNIQAKLEVKDKQIEELRKADSQKEKQIEEMIQKQKQFEQLIQSLIDSGQLKPLN